MDQAERSEADEPIVGILEPPWFPNPYVRMVWSLLLNDEDTIERFRGRTV